jgi:TonB family protein
MRGVAVFFGLFGAVAGSLVARAAPPSTAPAQAAAPEAPDPVMAFYPAGAKAAGVEGQAIIRCRRDEHLKMVGCSLVSETPSGQGFGAAALAMAAQSQPNLKLNLPDEKAAPPAETAIRFTLHPPTISPDITQVTHMLSQPSVINQPTRAQIMAAYPVRALSDGLEGRAAMVCEVTEKGGLSGCRVAAESPSGYGFGQAAIDLAGDYLVSPAKLDGEPIPNRPVQVRVAFTIADPDAPLTLDTKPAK